MAPREIEIEWDYRISRIPPLEIRLLACARSPARFRCWSILIGETHLNFSRRRLRRRRLRHPKPARHFEDYRRRYVTAREMSQAVNGKGGSASLPSSPLSSTAFPCQHFELTTLLLLLAEREGRTNCQALSLFSHFLVFRGSPTNCFFEFGKASQSAWKVNEQKKDGGGAKQPRYSRVNMNRANGFMEATEAIMDDRISAVRAGHRVAQSQSCVN